MKTLESLNRVRKCTYCNNLLEISSLNDAKNTVLYNGKYFHTKCFKQYCKERAEEVKKDGTPKKMALKYKEVLEHINEYVEASEKQIIESGVIHKDLLNYFLCEHYDLAIIPSSFWTKIEQIKNGAWKSLIQGIPVEHILDMWKRYIQELDKIAYYNKTHGKEMTNSQRLNYDLAILLNKYNDYLTIKKQEDDEAYRIQQEAEENHDYERTRAWIKNYYKRQKENPVDIEDEHTKKEQFLREAEAEIWGDDD